MENITNKLHLQSQQRPDSIAVCLRDSSFTYKELDDMVWRCATYLHQSDVKAGSVAAIMCQNELTLFVSLLALARIGGTAVVRKWQQNNETIDGLDLLNVETVIVDAELDLPSSFTQVSLSTALLLDQSKPLDYTVYEKEPAAPFLISTGSGTTGKPKLIPLGHSQVCARMTLIREMENLQIGDRIATLSDIEFSSTQFRALAALCVGATAVLARVDILSLTKKFRVTHLSALLHQLEELMVQLPDDSQAALGSLKSLSIGFATISDSVRKRIRRQLCENLFVGYGANECGAVSMAGPPSVFDSSGTVGFPLSGVAVEIVNSHHQILPVGNAGHVRIKSPGMIDGYIDDPEANDKAFKDGWFYPGDVGYLTEGGQLIHMGRSDDMMIMNGINIYPAEIEQAVVKHPDVLSAVAFSLKSAAHQDIPVCAVVLQPNTQRSEQEIIDFSRQYLGIRGPRRVVVVDDIPRTEQGKLNREQLYALMDKNKMVTQRAIWPKSIILRKYGQPAHSFKVKLSRDLFADLKFVDQWMATVLKIEMDRPLPKANLNGASPEVVRALAHMLRLAETLLNVIRVPAFDPMEVLKFDVADKDHFEVTVAVTYVDHIAQKVFSQALNLSASVMFKFMVRPPTAKNIQTLFDLIDKNFSTPFENVSGSGKSTMPILQAAHRLGIPFQHLSNGCYQLGWGSKAKMVNRSATQSDSALGMAMAQNKCITAGLLKDAGLPVPEHQIVNTVEQALASIEKLGWPVVVKPVDSDRGEGVTVDIDGPDGLQQAFAQAMARSRLKQVIIERQVNGVCCRVFIANGKMLYAVKRLPKSVRGNGISTVSELIAMANRSENALPPWKRSENFPTDALAIAAMGKGGAQLDTVPKDGELIPLRRIESTEWGGVDEDVSTTIHPDNVDLALRAARFFKLNVAGIDMITPDINESWCCNGAIVNEVNFSPQYGWGTISRRTIPAYLRQMFQDDGRIPVTVVVGDDAAFERGRIIQNELVSGGVNAYLTSHEISVAPTGCDVQFAMKGLYHRCRAMLVDSRVEALVLVVQTDELLECGLPVDCIDRIEVDSRRIQVGENPLRLSPERDVVSLLQLLELVS